MLTYTFFSLELIHCFHAQKTLINKFPIFNINFMNHVEFILGQEVQFILY